MEEILGVQVLEGGWSHQPSWDGSPMVPLSGTHPRGRRVPEPHSGCRVT